MTAPRQGPLHVVLLVIGVVLLLAGMAGAVVGLSGFIAALETAGYGSIEVRKALIFLGLSGGTLGTGISLTIWEVGYRLKSR